MNQDSWWHLDFKIHELLTSLVQKEFFGLLEAYHSFSGHLIQSLIRWAFWHFTIASASVELFALGQYIVDLFVLHLDSGTNSCVLMGCLGGLAMETRSFHYNSKVFLDCCDAGSVEFFHRIVHCFDPCRHSAYCWEISTLMACIGHICNFG